jgi:hypothetical protein
MASAPTKAQKTHLRADTREFMETLQRQIRDEEWSDEEIAARGFIYGHLADESEVALKLLTTRHVNEFGYDNGLPMYAVLYRPDREAPKGIHRYEHHEWMLTTGSHGRSEHVAIVSFAREAVLGVEFKVNMIAPRVVWMCAKGETVSRIRVINRNAFDLRLSNLEKEGAAGEASNENADPSQQDGVA